MKLGDVVVGKIGTSRSKTIWTDNGGEFVEVVKTSPESVRGTSTVAPIENLAVVERAENYKMVKLDLEELREVMKEEKDV